MKKLFFCLLFVSYSVNADVICLIPHNGPNDSSFFYPNGLWSNLRDALKKLGHDLVLPVHKPRHIDIIVHFNPQPTDGILNKCPSKRQILYAFEPPSVLPDMYEPRNHNIYEKVVTWVDSLVDNKKYFKYFLPHGYSKVDFDHLSKKNSALPYYPLISDLTIQINFILLDMILYDFLNL